MNNESEKLLKQLLQNAQKLANRLDNKRVPFAKYLEQQAEALMQRDSHTLVKSTLDSLTKIGRVEDLIDFDFVESWYLRKIIKLATKLFDKEYCCAPNLISTNV